MSLARKLGLLEVYCIATGAMVSSGLFILPGIAHAYAGPAVVFSYLFAGLLAASGMLSMAEIITAMPKAGGDYFFITRTMGPATGTVAGLLSWFSLTLKSSFALIGMSTFLLALINLNPHLTAIVICLVFVALNIVGAKESGTFQVVIVIGLLALMLVYIIIGLPKIDSRHFLPFAPHGWNPVFATAGIVFVSYGGLLKVAAIAEEIRNPGRIIPRGIIFSLIIIVLFYTLMVFVTTGVLSSDVLDHSLTPISTGARAFMGHPGMILLSLAAVLAFISTANAGIMSASRYLLSLSRDHLIPSPFGAVSGRFKTPHVAVLTTGIFVIGALFLNLETLVKAASTVLILTYVLANICLIILRESRLGNYRPTFKAPLYPFLPVVGIIGYVLLLIEMGAQALLVSAGLIVAGFLFYLLYGRIRTKTEYALLHLVERLSDREFTRGLLESELKDIIRERDDLCYDRFDDIVETAAIIDCDGSMTEQDLFSRISHTIAGPFHLDPNTVKAALEKRAGEGSTMLIPGVAVSDIICKGEKIFHMVIIRCREGVLLEGEQTPVHAYIVIVTTSDERDFYLKAIASIAQIIQHGHFEKRWKEARTEQHLRDLILLGERRRICT